MLKDIIFCSALVILLLEMLRLNQEHKKLNASAAKWLNDSKKAINANASLASENWKKQNDAIKKLNDANDALTQLLKVQEQKMDRLREEYKQSVRKHAIDIRSLHLRTDGVLHQLHERTKCLQPHNDKPQPN